MPRVRTLTPGASPGHFFGSEVRRAREAGGLSQSELGLLVPCDKSMVSRVEAGLVQADEAFAHACDTAFPGLDGFFARFWKDCQTWGSAFAQYQATPPRDEYLLTELGRSLRPVVIALAAWGNSRLEPGQRSMVLVDAETGTEADPVTVDANTGRRVDGEDFVFTAGPAASAPFRSRYRDELRRPEVSAPQRVDAS